MKMYLAGSTPVKWVKDANKEQLDEEEDDISDDELTRREVILRDMHRRVLEINAAKGIP